MEDVMETCWIDSVSMCCRGYQCETCPKELEYLAKKKYLEQKGQVLVGKDASSE